MKTLSLTRPYIVMVVGIPGAGKTFFARQFSDTFGAPVVSSERFRHYLFAEQKFTNQEQLLVAELTDYMIGEVLKSKRTFLIDGGCNARTERQRLESLAHKHGYDTLVVWVQTDQPTAELRVTKRNPKRADDTFSPSISVETLDRLTKRFTPPTHENYVVISGKHTYASQAKAVLRRLATPHAQEAEAAHQQKSQQARQQRATSPERKTEPPVRRSVIIR